MVHMYDVRTKYGLFDRIAENVEAVASAARTC